MSALPEMMRDRMPVWSALSEFFLDTELRDDHHRRIADVLARSPYSESALWEILRFEVYPPCHWNLLHVAGEWAMFGDDGLLERVAPRCGKRPRFTWPMLHRRMFHEHWDKVRAVLRDLRDGKLDGEPGTAPNGGPATPAGNSSAAEEPPSASRSRAGQVGPRRREINPACGVIGASLSVSRATNPRRRRRSGDRAILPAIVRAGPDREVDLAQEQAPGHHHRRHRQHEQAGDDMGQLDR